MTTEQFIEKSRKIHGGKYDYSKVEYTEYRAKVCIICPIHGEFWQTPAQHIAGHGCRKCAANNFWGHKKLSKEQFIDRAREIHGDKYDYSKVDYIDNQTKVCIICPIHGEFWQAPRNHLAHYGCKKCAIDKAALSTRMTKEKFIENARKVHGDKYDYSKVEYINSETKVCIICPKHGEFWQAPTRHLNSLGCKNCANDHKKQIRRMTNEEFKNKINEKYGNKFNLENTKYINSRTKIKVTCQIHGEIEIFPRTLLDCGCPKCNKENRIIKKKEKINKIIKLKNEIKQKKKNVLIENFHNVHGDKYDYSKINFINMSTKICIGCPTHGDFWQIPRNHLNGHGCPLCARENIKNKNKQTKEEFIKKAQTIHGSKYDYSKVEYVNNSTKVCIICPKHGEFWQTPAMHYSEHQGCPECGTLSSFGENEIYNYIHDVLLKTDIVKRDKTILSPQELDMYIPSHNLAIEYNGLRWHSEKFGKDKNYHINKTIECSKKGIKLIHIFEDEYNDKKEIVLNKIKHLLKCNHSPKINGRKCNISEITYDESKEFLNKNHIQGSQKATVYLGAKYNNELVGVMTFVKNKDNEWELNRFASNIKYICQGVGGILFSFFIKNYNPTTIKSFADRRWTINESDNLYTKLGFILKETLKPDYKYVINGYRRIHKFNFRKQILHKKYGFDLSMTEAEMAKKLKAYKIWDCGLFKYVWTKNN